MEITSENCSAYFDALVAQMRADGAFDDYQAPRGKAWNLPERPDKDEIQCPHMQAHKNTPGLGHFPGHETYSYKTAVAYGQRKLPRPSGEDMRFKRAITAEAIAQYFRPQAFADFLKYFRENPNLPSHKEALRQSLFRMEEQIFDPSLSNAVHERGRFTAAQIEQTIEEMRAVGFKCDAEKLWGQLSESEYLERAYKHPEMVLALATFHASHRAYLSQMMAAIDHSGMVSPQSDNADYVMGRTGSMTFDQFNKFQLFNIFMPLVVRELEIAKAARPDASDVTLLNEGAMDRAWELLFTLKLLTHVYPLEDLEPEEAARIRAARERKKAGEDVPFHEVRDVENTCPALAHLKMVHQSHLLEQSLSFIDENRMLLRSQLEAAKNAAQDAAAEARGEFGFAIAR